MDLNTHGLFCRAQSLKSVSFLPHFPGPAGAVYLPRHSGKIASLKGMAGKGSAPGERRGGRQKGTPNQITKDVAARLAAIGCDPIIGMAQLAMGIAECTHCGARGKVLNPDNPMRKIPCPACHGTKRELVAIELRARMFSELANYVAPKRKSIEHVEDPNAGGDRIAHNPVEVARRVAFILLQGAAESKKGD